MTKRDRAQVLWLRDFVRSALDNADDVEFERGAIAAKAMLERWLVASSACRRRR